MKKNDPELHKKMPESQPEDVDITQLFKLLGKALSDLLNFVLLIFKTILSWCLGFLLFIRLNLKKMIIGACLAGAIGAVYQYGIRDVQYESSMTVEPNFGSTVQLYKNIDYYVSLVKQEDYERLASSLQITKEEAESITWIQVVPYSNENQKLLAYKDFIAELDSNAVKIVNFKTFAKEQPIESFKYHVITVFSKNNQIFEKLESPMINSIINNSYYDELKKTAYANLLNKKTALETSMSELDSLRTLYKKVLLAESSRESNGTNIFMSELGNNTKEVEVFDKYMTMNEELNEVNRQLTAENEVVNVVSSFNAIGMKVKTWYKNFAIMGFIGGFLLMFLLISIRKLDNLLVVYKDQLSEQ